MVLIVDFGSQYTELLVRQVRANQVFAELKDCDDKDLIEEASKYEALILSGSPNCAKDELHEGVIKALINLNKPILCVCYGMQVVHKMLGGKLVCNQCSEFGSTEIKITKDHYLVDGIPTKFTTWMSHNDSITELAPGFVSVASSKVCHSIAADDRKKIYTIQFHPEVEHTNYGDKIIYNFLFLICKLKQTWKTEGIIETKVKQIREKVGTEKIYLAVSGGLDSSVVASLLKASKVDAYYIFVNTGLIWDTQMKPIIEWLRSEFGKKLIVIDARERFFEGLKGVTDPEEKRKKIGTLFLEVFKEEVAHRGGSKFLAQGTIKSDLIESGKRIQSQAIKTHHNTINDLKEFFEIVEPVSNLFKDEVRKLAKKLNLPPFIANSQPFPGTGYAIRILGEVTQEKTEILKQVDAILLDELTKRNIYQSVSQCFAVIMNQKSVGVVGDRRNYGHVVAIRAVDSKNIMTAKPSLIPIETLAEIGSIITNKIPIITRIVYDLTSKPPATIEWE